VFRKDASVFREWKEDTPQGLVYAFERDTHYWKVLRMIKDP